MIFKVKMLVAILHALLSNDSHKNDSKSYFSTAMAISPHRISLILGRKLELLNVT